MPDNNNPLADITVPENNQIQVRANAGGSVRVLVMKNDDSGAVNYREVPAGSTVRDVLGDDQTQRVRVNGQPATPDQPVQNGDKLVATPNNINGA